jgi:hypothetical protein
LVPSSLAPKKKVPNPLFNAKLEEGDAGFQKGVTDVQFGAKLNKGDKGFEKGVTDVQFGPKEVLRDIHDSGMHGDYLWRLPQWLSEYHDGLHNDSCTTTTTRSLRDPSGAVPAMSLQHAPHRIRDAMRRICDRFSE